MDEYKNRLVRYQIAMSLARKMLAEGVITDAEYRKIECIMTKKYDISSFSICR